MTGTLLALDLSLNCTGYAVITWNSKQQKATVLAVGHIDNKKKGRMKDSHGRKLCRIYTELQAVIQQYPQITHVAREQGFSRFNKATQALFRVVGIADYLVEQELQQVITEYSVSTVKKVVGGNGKADKAVVAENLLNYIDDTEITFKTDDESDAVAVGICHFLSIGGQ